jgi:hypothetical protein
MTRELISQNSKIFFRFLGAVKIQYTRKQLLELFVDSINLQNGDVTIKVQNGKIVFLEARSALRNNEMESLETLNLS